MRITAWNGTYVRCTPSNSAFSFSSEGSTRIAVRSPKMISPISTNP